MHAIRRRAVQLTVACAHADFDEILRGYSLNGMVPLRDRRRNETDTHDSAGPAKHRLLIGLLREGVSAGEHACDGERNGDDRGDCEFRHGLLLNEK
ncbi:MULTISPECIES: hypothetical protein [Burkholderia]|uniref:hypothetical protein n=1 Tax=Burkholderia TaxID=32008 RepID=UPI001178C309|nr:MULTISPECIES: hypothetical protein [Burkholderia]HDR9758718.1 hypothetical protein [Burkholderia cepacia ATCC 25416]HDR9794035.1 hypothetical protein [Burkholderia cepacia ATCC 25416]